MPKLFLMGGLVVAAILIAVCLNFQPPYLVKISIAIYSCIIIFLCIKKYGVKDEFIFSRRLIVFVFCYFLLGLIVRYFGYKQREIVFFMGFLLAAAELFFLRKDYFKTIAIIPLASVVFVITSLA